MYGGDALHMYLYKCCVYLLKDNLIAMNYLHLIVIASLGRCDTTQAGETGKISDFDQ